MPASPATYITDTAGAHDVIEALMADGFAFNRAEAVTCTVLDTFDGLLNAQRLRLVAVEAGRIELRLSGPGIVSAQVTAAAIPRWPEHLPPGPFRTRVASVVDVRALLPLIAVTSRQTVGVLTDRSDKTVVSVTVHDERQVVGRPDVEMSSSTVEIGEFTGYGTRGRTTREIVEARGLECVDGDMLSLAAVAAGVDLAGLSSSPTVPLDPTMPAVEGVRAVLANLADTIDANLSGTIERLDPEFLHELRVAVRRTRSVLRQCRRTLPVDVVARVSEGFSSLGRITGPARDLDVHVIEWDTYTRSLDADAVTALDPVKELLDRRRDHAYVELADVLRTASTEQLIGEWRSWLTNPLPADAPIGDHADRPLGSVVARRIRTVHDNLVERGRLITPDTEAERVHDLRKDAKKLRYLLECFGSMLSTNDLKRLVKRLKAFQNVLGDHQDAEVHIAELRSLSTDLHDAGADPETIVAMGRLIEQLDRRRGAARAEFAHGFEEFDSSTTRSSLDSMLAEIVR